MLALPGLILILAAFLFQAFDEVLAHAAMEALQEPFVQLVNADQLDHVREVLVAASGELEFDERSEVEIIDVADSLAHASRIR